ncbi:MAG: hypothetical protein ACTSRC_10275 [Candidatus Helarchaeota archaeon]
MKISNEQLLRIIALAGVTSQPELQKKTELKQNTHSIQISKLRKERKVKTPKIRKGKANISIVSLANFDNQNTIDTQVRIDDHPFGNQKAIDSQSIIINNQSNGVLPPKSQLPSLISQKTDYQKSVDNQSGFDNQKSVDNRKFDYQNNFGGIDIDKAVLLLRSFNYKEPSSYKMA